MERLSYELINNMQKLFPCKTITWGYSQKYLPIFLLIASVRSLYYLSSRKIDLIHIGDALLSPFGLLLKKITGRPVAVNLHGLDMTFPNRLYQRIIRSCLPKLDLFVCNSRNTRDIAIGIGVPGEKTRVIPCGIQVKTKSPVLDEETMRLHLQQSIEEDIGDRRLALTVGRLVKRKGVGHFVGEILPKIVSKHQNLLYLVVGKGDEEEAIHKEVVRAHMENHVRIVGRVDAKTLDALYEVSDVFIMPNIRVDGDVEGFGIVALEASLAGLPVVAFAVEGIIDAVKDGVNGLLIDPEDNSAFATAVIDLLQDHQKRIALGDQGMKYTASEFGWDRITERYSELFTTCVERSGISRDSHVKTIEQ
jgi:phosphatidylinositol alpha-1,6-mannosyltransferase